MTKATILIVDKEKILLDLLVRTLSSPDLSVVAATSADEAARLVEVHRPDLLVIDPSTQNAVQLISSVRSSSLKTKLVAVVGSDEIRERIQALHIETIVDRNAGLESLVSAIRAALPTDLRILGETGRAVVLICDDEEDIRVLLSEFLSGHRFVISTAKNGIEGLERVEQDPSIQIVLLDLGMPLMGGMEVLNRIMKRDRHPSVIMLTAVADRDVAKQAIKGGAFDYILKPFDFASIESTIEACLSYTEYQNRPWWKRLTGG